MSDDLAERRGLETAVYQPAEDSALLVSAAIPRIARDDRALDLGTGSGWVGATIARETGATVIASDVNPHACRSAAEAGLASVRGDGTTPFRNRTFDVIAFNPPYLPAQPAGARDDWMESALTGGRDGRAVIERVLPDIGRVLRPDGRLLLVASTLTGIDAVLETAATVGLDGEVIAEESFPFETLVVLECTPASADGDHCGD